MDELFELKLDVHQMLLLDQVLREVEKILYLPHHKFFLDLNVMEQIRILDVKKNLDYMLATNTKCGAV